MNCTIQELARIAKISAASLEDWLATHQLTAGDALWRAFEVKAFSPDVVVQLAVVGTQDETNHCYAALTRLDPAANPDGARE